MSEALQKIESLKEHFRFADSETKMMLDNLEKSIKRNSLYLNLADHDAVKMILEFCDNRFLAISLLLENQKAEDLASEAGRMNRAYQEAYRDAFAWFRKIFTISKANVATKEKMVNKIENSI